MSKVIILAAGGTGGHIFPAEALAEAMLARGYVAHLITDRRFHHYNKNSAQGTLSRIPIHTIHADSLGGGLIAKLIHGINIVRGTIEAWLILRKLKPAVVVGFGGYPSFPTMLAAVLRGEKTVLHEQNSVLGKVNRFLASHVHAIALSYSDTQRLPLRVKQKIITGNPVRAAVQAIAKLDYPELEEDGLMRILVVGGSQGASVFSEVVPAAMAQLPEAIRKRIRLDQQCRAIEIDKVRAAYAGMDMQVDLAPFFADVATRLVAAHLVVCRAGASTVAELTCAGRPAILVPLPQATDNHQYYNARSIEDLGAGWVVTQDAFTPDMLATKIETLMLGPQRLAECAEVMHHLGRPNAAEKLADAVLQAAGT